MTPPTKNDLENTLAETRRSGLDFMLGRYKICPPGNADGIPPAYTAKPTGRKGSSE